MSSMRNAALFDGAQVKRDCKEIEGRSAREQVNLSQETITKRLGKAREEGE